MRWKIGLIKILNIGKDGSIRSATVRTSNRTVTRAIAHLYSLKINAPNSTNEIPLIKINKENETEKTLSKRKTAKVANEETKQIFYSYSRGEI